jgi:predicted acylesterase/phospholipase RssA
MQLNNNLKPIDFEIPSVAYGFQGGALAGPYPAGVMTAHGQMGLVKKASLFMGTSVGSANGAVGALDWTQLAALWENIKTSKDVWKGDLNNKFTDVWGALFAESILDPAPFYAIIDKIFGNMTMEQLAKIHDIELIFPAVDNNTHQIQFFSSFGPYKNLKVADVIKASTAIPAGLKSHKIDLGNNVSHWFSDGGVGANNPLIAVQEYNRAFPVDMIKKLILIYCSGDIPAVDNKDYRLARDAGLVQIQNSLEVQEQVSENLAELMTSYGVIDICAIYHKGGLGDSMVADPKRLDVGYQDGVSMVVWDYKLQANISIIDFLKRK